MKKIDIENTEADAGADERNSQVDPAAEPLVQIETGTLTPEQLEELKERAAKADEHWERLLRTTADFDNFKKRAAREKQDAIRYANEGLLEKLVPVLDNFDAALAAVQTGSNDSTAAQSLQTGVAMIFQQLKKVLTDAGLEEVNATGQKFDPNLHEAVSQQESAEIPKDRSCSSFAKATSCATACCARPPSWSPRSP